MTFTCGFQIKISFMYGIFSSIESHHFLLLGEKVKKKAKYLEATMKAVQ